ASGSQRPQRRMPPRSVSASTAFGAWQVPWRDEWCLTTSDDIRSQKFVLVERKLERCSGGSACRSRLRNALEPSRFKALGKRIPMVMREHLLPPSAGLVREPLRLPDRRDERLGHRLDPVGHLEMTARLEIQPFRADARGDDG